MPHRAAAPGHRATYRALVLVQPMPSLTNLALGLVTVYLVWRLRRGGEVVTHWRAALVWAAGTALAGAVYHGVLVGIPRVTALSWAITSVMVVVVVSYVLARRWCRSWGGVESSCFGCCARWAWWRMWSSRSWPRQHHSDHVVREPDNGQRCGAVDLGVAPPSPDGWPDAGCHRRKHRSRHAAPGARRGGAGGTGPQL